MTLLVASLWPQLAAALALGLAVGALTGLPRSRPALAAAGLPCACLAGLSALALLRTAPGAAGLWIETAALLLGAYLAGCGLGGFGRNVVGRPTV